MGKGLGALLGDAALQTQEGGSVLLPISKVEVGPNQPRKRFNQEALADLASSIRQHGILQSITVRRLASGYYQIIAGERRWRAARMAGLDEVPALVIEADDRKGMELALIENLQREDLNPVEEAGGYQLLMEEHGLTQEEISAQVGKSRPAVTNALRLLSLTPPVLKMVEEGQLSGGHARALLSIKDEKLQYQTALRVAEGGLSVRQTEALTKRLQKNGDNAEPTGAPVEAVNYFRELERELTSRFSRRVRIHPGSKKGRLELEYYGEDDLEALVNALDRLDGADKGGYSD